jgi:hypothetical protein
MAVPVVVLPKVALAREEEAGKNPGEVSALLGLGAI